MKPPQNFSHPLLARLKSQQEGGTGSIADDRTFQSESSQLVKAHSHVINAISFSSRTGQIRRGDKAATTTIHHHGLTTSNVGFGTMSKSNPFYANLIKLNKTPSPTLPLFPDCAQASAEGVVNKSIVVADKQHAEA